MLTGIIKVDKKSTLISLNDVSICIVRERTIFYPSFGEFDWINRKKQSSGFRFGASIILNCTCLCFIATSVIEDFIVILQYKVCLIYRSHFILY